MTYAYLGCLDVARLYPALRCCGQCHENEVDGYSSLSETHPPSRNPRMVLSYCCAIAGVVNILTRSDYAKMFWFHRRDNE